MNLRGILFSCIYLWSMGTFAIQCPNNSKAGDYDLNENSFFSDALKTSLTQKDFCNFTDDVVPNDLQLTARDYKLLKQLIDRSALSLTVTDLSQQIWSTASIEGDLNMCSASINKIIAVPTMFHWKNELHWDYKDRTSGSPFDLMRGMILYSYNTAASSTFKRFLQLSDNEGMGSANKHMQRLNLYSPDKGGLYICTGYARNCSQPPEVDNNSRVWGYSGSQIATSNMTSKYFLGLACNSLVKSTDQEVYQSIKEIFSYPVKKQKNFPINYGLAKALVSSETDINKRPQKLYRKSGSLNANLNNGRMVTCANDAGYVKTHDGREYVSSVFISAPMDELVTWKGRNFNNYSEARSDLTKIIQSRIQKRISLFLKYWPDSIQRYCNLSGNQ